MISHNGDHPEPVRHLPAPTALGRPTLLISDTPHGPVSRIAAQLEAAQLGLAEHLLGRARDAKGSQLAHFAPLLTDALADTLHIAHGRSTPYDGPAPRYGDTLTLPGTDPTTSRTARHHIREAAQARKLPPRLIDDLEIITGELVANALEHTGSRTITVTFVLTRNAAAVTVTDEGPGGPLLTCFTPPPDEEGGRGLLITHALSARWGTCRTRHGLTVWAELGPAEPTAAAH